MKIETIFDNVIFLPFRNNLKDMCKLFHFAAEEDLVDTLSFLLPIKDFHIDEPNKFGNTPLKMALWRSSYKTAELLIENGADVKAICGDNRDTPLHEASSGCHLLICEMLIERGADVNAKDSYGRTPLMDSITTQVVSRDKLKVVKYLVEKGADVNAVDINKHTILKKAFIVIVTIKATLKYLLKMIY